MAIKTNDLRKGARVRLNCGWEADIADNAKGNTRMCKVYGHYTEIGSVYSHDIVEALIDGQWIPVEHTPAQMNLRSDVGRLFG